MDGLTTRGLTSSAQRGAAATWRGSAVRTAGARGPAGGGTTRCTSRAYARQVVGGGTPGQKWSATRGTRWIKVTQQMRSCDAGVRGHIPHNRMNWSSPRSSVDIGLFADAAVVWAEGGNKAGERASERARPVGDDGDLSRGRSLSVSARDWAAADPATVWAVEVEHQAIATLAGNLNVVDDTDEEDEDYDDYRKSCGHYRDSDRPVSDESLERLAAAAPLGNPARRQGAGFTVFVVQQSWEGRR